MNRKLPITATTDLGNRLNGELVLYLGDLLRLFAVAQVENPKNRV